MVNVAEFQEALFPSKDSRLLEQSIEAFGEDIMRRFPRLENNQILPFTQTGGARHEDAIQRKYGKIPEAYASIKVTNLSGYYSGYNPASLRRGINLGRSSDEKSAYIMKAEPAQVTLSISIHSQGIKYLFESVKVWIRCSRRISLNMMSEGINLASVQCVLDNDVSLPEEDPSYKESGNSRYTLELSAELHSWIGSIYKVPTIKSLKTNFYIPSTDNTSTDDAAQTVTTAVPQLVRAFSFTATSTEN